MASALPCPSLLIGPGSRRRRRRSRQPRPGTKLIPGCMQSWYAVSRHGNHSSVTAAPSPSSSFLVDWPDSRHVGRPDGQRVPSGSLVNQCRFPGAINCNDRLGVLAGTHAVATTVDGMRSSDAGDQLRRDRDSSVCGACQLVRNVRNLRSRAWAAGANYALTWPL